MSRPDADVLVLGGGIAGLWTLHVLLSQGYDAHLAETSALGAGQSVQAQGIVHGGGKYALRAVGDVDAMRAIRDMPARWREHHTGVRGGPDLRNARMLADACWLWMPRGSWWARLQSWGLAPVLRHGGVLACPPETAPRAEWPPILDAHAQLALRMAEPVFDTGSVLAALREPIVDRLLHIEPIVEGGLRSEDGAWNVRLDAPGGAGVGLRFGAIVLCAGRGNGDLMRCAGIDDPPMQERPLQMTMLRGRLPRLHAHCISGGRTRITVTSVGEGDDVVWQVGGEIAELQSDAPPDAAVTATLDEVRACLPGLDLAGIEAASYRAVRAEARNRSARRPSGVHVEGMAPGLLVAWPTKWAMAPLLAEDVLEQLRAQGLKPTGPQPLDGTGGWPRPDVAPYPWEDASWRAVHSAARA